jgi:putative protease
VEEKHPGEYMPAFEDDRGTYIMNARDLCLLGHLPDLIKAGVNSFKIEGRMKSAYYVATVTRVYRRALDSYLSDPANYSPDQSWHEELAKISHRPYSTGFLHGNPGPGGQVYHTTAQEASHEFVGVVRAYLHDEGRVVVEMRNRFATGELLEVLGPSTDSRQVTVSNLHNGEGEPIGQAIRVQELVSFDTPFPVDEYSLLRRRINPR